MRAILFHSFGSTEVLQVSETERPTPAKDEVLVMVKAAALNPKDIMVRKGKFKVFTGKKFPMKMGYDFAGIIVDPNGRADFKKGDEIFGMINSWKAGAFAEYLAVPANELALKPDSLSFEEAAGLPLVSLTALQALRDRGKLLPGQKVLIHGASGGVGTMAIQIAKALGAEVHTTSSQKNFELCIRLGADKTFDYKETNPDELKEQYDICFDVFGNQEFPKIKKILKPTGRYVGTIPDLKLIIRSLFSVFSSKKASLVVVKSNAADLQVLSLMIESGQIKAVLDRVFPFTDVREAQAYLETKRAKGKVVLQIS